MRRPHVPPSPAAGGPSSPAPGPSTPRSHRYRCGRASLCGHGHGGRVRACRVVRARTRYACDAFASPAVDAPSRARRLCRADARSSGEGATKRERVGRSGRGIAAASDKQPGCSGVANSCRVVRGRARHACDVCVNLQMPRVGRSGRGHRCCMRRCLSLAGVLGSLTRPAVRGGG